MLEKLYILGPVDCLGRKSSFNNDNLYSYHSSVVEYQSCNLKVFFFFFFNVKKIFRTMVTYYFYTSTFLFHVFVDCRWRWGNA